MIKSRRLGVFSADNPAQKIAVSNLTDLNVAAMTILAERGPEEVLTLNNTQEFTKFFGGYKSGYFGKYAVEGFFQNAGAIAAKAKIRRFVAADAVSAKHNVPAGDSAASLVTLVNELKTDINAHLSGHASYGSANDTSSITAANAIDLDTAIVLLKNIRSVYSAHNNDATSASPSYHSATGTDYSLSKPTPVDLETALDAANEVKAQYSLHIADTTAHGTSADSTNTVSAADATDGSLTDDELTLEAGTFGRSDKGAWGNNLGYKILPSSKFDTTTSSAATAADTIISVVNVAGFEVNDLVSISDGTNIEGGQVTAKNETLGQITVNWTGGSGLANSYASGSTVKILNFDLEIYYKSSAGIVKLVEKWEGLTKASSTGNYTLSINNEFTGSQYVKVTSIGSSQSNFLFQNPAPSDGIVMFTDTAGSDGAAPVNQDWIDLYSEFNEEKDIRYMANPESVNVTVQKAGESYCRTRGDIMFFITLPSDQTFAQLKVIGKQYLTADSAYGWIPGAQWLQVSDPIGVGVNPLIDVPNVGHMMGYTLSRIANEGYQRVPAGPQVSIQGVENTTGGKAKQILSDLERTELADLGVNVIQFITGSGFVLRNARTISSDLAYRWFNQNFMRIVYKKTFEDSLKGFENRENGTALLDDINFLIGRFLEADYEGSARTGGKSAFLQVTKADGSASTFADVVQIIADESNNTVQDVLQGRVNVDIYFTPPPPAESIRIGVGISLNIAAQ